MIKKIDCQLIETNLDKGLAFSLILSKRQMSLFLEIARDLPLYRKLLIKNRPVRPLLRGLLNIVYTSIFHKELYELVSYFYKNEKILLCEINGLENKYELKFIPGSRAEPGLAESPHSR